MIHLHLDISPITELAKELDTQVKKAMDEGLQSLAVQTHAHIVEEVQSKLHSTREKYLEHLHIEQEEEGVWVISLDQDAMWIEEGMDQHEMIDDLLKSDKAKTAADGSKYTVVPFKHNKGPSQQTPEAKSLTDAIKKEFKAQGAPWGKMETDEKGNVKTGMVRSFDILKQPLKDKVGPGQGHGPIGQVRQGMTGIPFLQGVRVYQKEVKGPGGKAKFEKSVMTFRVASSKQRGSGMWVHPGLEAKHFLDEAAEWAQKEFEEKIRQGIIVSLTKKLK